MGGSPSCDFRDDYSDNVKDRNLRFYRNEIKSSSYLGGYTIDEMLSWRGKYQKLEDKHDYIQWLFPIPGSRGMNSSAQPLYEEEARAIRDDKITYVRVIKAYDMMLDFYGMFLLNVEDGTVVRGKHGYEKRYENLNRSSHNNRRITRILISLGELGFERYQAPWIKLLMEEAIVHRVLPNLNGGCMYHWIAAIKDEGEREHMYRVYLNLQEKHKLHVSPPLNTYNDRAELFSTCEYVDSNPYNSGRNRIDSSDQVKDETMYTDDLCKGGRETDVDACMIQIHENNDENSGCNGDIDSSSTNNDENKGCNREIDSSLVTYTDNSANLKGDKSDNSAISKGDDTDNSADSKGDNNDKSAILKGDNTGHSDGLTSGRGVDNVMDPNAHNFDQLDESRDLATDLVLDKPFQFHEINKKVDDNVNISLPLSDSKLAKSEVSDKSPAKNFLTTIRKTSDFNASELLVDQVHVNSSRDNDENTSAKEDGKDCSYKSQFPTEMISSGEDNALVSDSLHAVENGLKKHAENVLSYGNSTINNNNSDTFFSTLPDNKDAVYDNKPETEGTESVQSGSSASVNNMADMSTWSKVQNNSADLGAVCTNGCQSETRTSLSVDQTSELDNQTNNEGSKKATTV